MGVYNNGNIVIVNGGTTRPTHGEYILGTLLYDDNTGEKRWYVCTNLTEPIIWTKLPNSWNVNKNPIEEKYGVYIANSMTCKGEGMMQDVQPLGATFTANNIDGSGTSHNFNTGSSVSQNAGIAILRPVGTFAGFTRPSFIPSFIMKNVLPARTDCRFYSGFPTTTAGMLVGEAPIDQANGGLVVGYNAADTTWSVWHGDGTNAITKVQMSTVNVPAGVVDIRTEIIFTASGTNAVVNLYNGSNVLLESKTITTNLPADGKSLNWSNVIQNVVAGTAKALTIYGGWMGASR